MLFNENRIFTFRGRLQRESPQHHDILMSLHLIHYCWRLKAGLDATLALIQLGKFLYTEGEMPPTSQQCFKLHEIQFQECLSNLLKYYFYTRNSFFQLSFLSLSLMSCLLVLTYEFRSFTTVSPTLTYPDIRQNSIKNHELIICSLVLVEQSLYLQSPVSSLHHIAKPLLFHPYFSKFQSILLVEDQFRLKVKYCFQR